MLDQDIGYIPRRRKSPRDNGYLLGRPNGTKILKALDEHGEALKKMEGCLTSLEESRLNKSTHVEVHDKEEEVEEWDEKDKVEYERNKQFKKLAMETIAMREKMEKMQLAFLLYALM